MNHQLKAARKTNRNFLIYLDEKPAGIMPQYRLKLITGIDPEAAESGMEISSQQFQMLQSEILERARKRLFDWLARQEHSEKECRNYLWQLYLSEEMMADLVEQARKLNFVRDERFIEMYIRSQIENGKSLLEIRHKLWEKIDDENLLESSLAEFYDSHQQQEVLRKNLEKLWQMWRNLEIKERQEKIINQLTRRGYSYDEVKEGLFRLEESEEQNESQ